MLFAYCFIERIYNTKYVLFCQTFNGKKIRNFILFNEKEKELKYILAYVAKETGFEKPMEFVFEEDQQFIFESSRFIRRRQVLI